MAINIRNIGPTVGFYNPLQQRQQKEDKKSADNIDSTPANNPNDSSIGTIANGTSAIINGKTLYDKFSGSNIPSSPTNENKNGISTGNNIESSEQYQVTPKVSEPQDIELSPDQYYEDNLFSYDFLEQQNNYLQQTNDINDVTNSTQDGLNLKEIIETGSPTYSYKTKENNLINVRQRGFNTDNGVVGARDLGDIKLDWWTARNVALPVLQYAAQYQQLDSTNKWLQSGKTLQRIMQGFAGTYEGTNVPVKTALDNYYISNFVDLADMAHNWHNRTDFANAMTGVNSAMSLIKNLGLEEYMGGVDSFSKVYDGMAMINFGHSLYQLTNNWDKMNNAERTASAIQTMLVGMQAYDGGTSLIKAFSPAAQISTPTSSPMLSAPVSGAGEYTSAISGTPVTSEGLTEANAYLAGEGQITTEAGNTAMNELAINEGSKEIAKDAAKAGGQTTSGVTAGSTAGVLTGGATAVLGAFSMYKGIEGMADSFGYGTADSRKAMSLSGAAAGAGAAGVTVGLSMASSTIASALGFGATIGSTVPVVGTIIGAVVGAAVGLAMGAVKSGKSKEQRARDNWRTVYTNAGIFTKSNTDSSIGMQLADGSFYNVGIDGSGSRATDINGTVKSYANPNLIAGRDTKNASKGLLPYNVDYTNALDFVGSLMVTGMVLPVGGSYQKNNTKEVPQMLGYMTNGITSNCGREFTKSNYNIMTSNVKALYTRMGITNKEQMINCVSDAYYQGKLSKSDYYNMITSSNLIYDDNGYQQAKALMKDSGKAGMGKTEVKTKE